MSADGVRSLMLLHDQIPAAVEALDDITRSIDDALEHMSYRALARALGVSHSQIQRWKQGFPDARRLRATAAYM